LDAICLDFCIALLDHPLLGSLHDSLVVGFLAILGVVRDTSTFQTPLNYTPQLLGFIKIRQMLVLQKAVHLVEAGQARESTTPLEEMHQRFMTVNCPSPYKLGHPPTLLREEDCREYYLLRLYPLVGG
jgi:hypothetical protein